MKVGRAPGDNEETDADLRSFPSIVGRPRVKEAQGLKDIYVGDDAFRRQEQLTISEPIKLAVVRNWEDMETVWRHCFSELGIQAEEQPMLLSEPDLNPKENREKATQIMFETFNVPSMFLLIQSKMALFGAGITTGLVLDVGHQVTRVAPILEGSTFMAGIWRSELAGEALTDSLIAMLNENNKYAVETRTHRNIVRDMKEKTGYVALSYEDEAKNAEADASSFEMKYELPDGQALSVGVERFKCAEALFQPQLIGMESDGVHKMVNNSIMKCDAEVRQQLFGNILLSGGATMATGLDARLTKEVTALAPDSMKVKVIAPPKRDELAWRGGAIFSAMSSYGDSAISKKEYEETGAGIVHKKCF